MIDPDLLDWEKMDGLIPAIVQDVASGEVRMLGYVDRSALETTIREGQATFFSRSRGGQWLKGETSGNVLDVVDIRQDCDGDAILILVRPRGPTCHLGSQSCFGNDGAPGTGFLADLAKTVGLRAAADPAESYTARLMADGVKRIAQKVGEEAVETALAAVAADRAELEAEAADLMYHMTVLLQAAGSSWEDVMAELRQRHVAGIATSAS